MSGPSVAVIGGGLSGAVAAFRLRRLLGGTAEITVFESTGSLGGKLRTARLAGVPFDVGAEAFLVTRPEMTALAGEIGLTDRVRVPSPARSLVRAGQRSVPLPARTVMGIPATPGTVAEVLSEHGSRRVAEEPARPFSLPAHDVSLGAVLRERFGDELVDRLVDPLLGGVYAGGADGLGVRATLPGLVERLENGARSLTEAAAAMLPAPSDDGVRTPVFGTVDGGLGVLIDRLARRSGARLRLGVPVRGLRRTERGWTLALGAAAPEHAPAEPEFAADAVLLAVPAPAARRLLSDVAPGAADALSGIELASMAVLGFAFPPGTELPGASGVLIGAGERHSNGTPFTAKAFTFSSRKWPHLGHPGEPVLLRGSVGRFGDRATLRADDDELAKRVLADLAELTGITVTPIDTVVTRWGGGLPQYAPGHLDRVARIESEVARLPGVAITGAMLHGVGLPACAASADTAAARVANWLKHKQEVGG